MQARRLCTAGHHRDALLVPQDTVEALPELLEAVQAVLLDMLALVLANRTFRTATPIRRAALTQALNAGAVAALCRLVICLQPTTNRRIGTSRTAKLARREIDEGACSFAATRRVMLCCVAHTHHCASGWACTQGHHD